MPMKRGSILAETVLVMPLLLLLIFGVIQFALIWTAKQMTAYAALCATRAIMVVPPGEQQKAAQDAAEVALSWMCMAEKDGQSSSRVNIPGWGRIPGSASSSDRVEVEVMANGADNPIAAVEVRFKYPLLIPGMAVNRIVANRRSKVKDAGDKSNFYGDLDDAAKDADTSVDGFWPWIELTEACVLPMPYSTARFPTGGFDGTDIHGGD